MIVLPKGWIIFGWLIGCPNQIDRKL